MYQKQSIHTVSCGNNSLMFDSFKFKNELSAAQIPLMNGGFYTKLLGVKWEELVIEGKLSEADKSRYNTFINAVRGSTVNLTIDGTAYNGCTMIQSELSMIADSRLLRFCIVFRRY